MTRTAQKRRATRDRETASPSFDAVAGSHTERVRLVEKLHTHVNRLVKLQESFGAFVPFRAAAAQDDQVPFLGFDNDGMVCLMSQAILLARHVNGIETLLRHRYPVQTLILLRAVMEAWFYILAWFEKPSLAGDYIKKTVTAKGRPKYQPWEMRQRAVRIARRTPHDFASEWADLIDDEYKISCEMVHMSDPGLYVSFGLPGGEKSIRLGASTLDDNFVFMAYARVLHVSSTFWLVCYLNFLSKDKHPHASVLAKDLHEYVIPAVELVLDLNAKMGDASKRRT